MQDLLLSPIIWVAIVTTVGVTVGQLFVAYGRLKEHKLSLMESSIAVLQTEYARLNAEVKNLRSEAELYRKKERLVTEKYSVSLGFISGLLASGKVFISQLSSSGIDRDVVLPEVPELIADDMRHRWPEAFD